jgi:hypothetical protein
MWRRLMNQRPISSRTVLAPFKLALIPGKMAYCEGTGMVLRKAVE